MVYFIFTVYSQENLKSVKSYIMQNTNNQGVDLATGDGGFEISVKDGEHKENMQELFSHRIKVSEVLYALETLKTGGSFVLKLFDTVSWLTISIVYLCARVFERVKVVKPFRSRVVNSERYLVCIHYCGDSSDERDALAKALKKIHERFNQENATDSHECSPVSVIPESIIKQDDIFMASLERATKQLIQEQTTGLHSVIDTAESIVHIAPEGKRMKRAREKR